MQYIAVGSVGQWLIKPLLGLILALTLVPILGLPNAVGTGLILVRCYPDLHRFSPEQLNARAQEPLVCAG